MLLYKDIFTGDTILTDSYKMTLIDDFYYEVEATYITKKEGGISDAMIGGNPSAEDEAEDVDDASVKRGFDIILNHEALEEWEFYTSFDQFKSAFKKILKKLPSTVKERSKDEHSGVKEYDESYFKTDFPKKLTTFMKKIKEEYDNLQLFFGSSFVNNDNIGVPVFVLGDATGLKAKIWYLKDFLEEEKM